MSDKTAVVKLTEALVEVCASRIDKPVTVIYSAGEDRFIYQIDGKDFEVSVKEI